MKNKVKQGKQNRAAGTRFELKVRKDLEDKGWIVSKWMNNVELRTDFFIISEGKKKFTPTIKKSDMIKWMHKDAIPIEADRDMFTPGKLVPAKHKFRGPGIPMVIGTGFPDFITFRRKK